MGDLSGKPDPDASLQWGKSMRPRHKPGFAPLRSPCSHLHTFICLPEKPIMGTLRGQSRMNSQDRTEPKV